MSCHYPEVGSSFEFRAHPEGYRPEELVKIEVTCVDLNNVMIKFLKVAYHVKVEIPIPQHTFVWNITKDKEMDPVNGWYWLLPRSDEYNVECAHVYPSLSLKKNFILPEEDLRDIYACLIDSSESESSNSN